MRDSVLLSFMFTYGLCRPMIERFLVSEGEEPLEVEGTSLARVTRTANERGVLRADWTTWAKLQDARNSMADVYSEPVAEGILAKVPIFLEEASYLFEQLTAKSAER